MYSSRDDNSDNETKVGEQSLDTGSRTEQRGLKIIKAPGHVLAREDGAKKHRSS